MIHLNTKPQNRDRIFTIFVLGGIRGILDMGFKGLFPFIVDGGIILVVTVILGNITHSIFKKIGFDLFETEQEENILDAEIEEMSQETEAQKDLAALNYGIVWALLFIILTLL